MRRIVELSVLQDYRVWLRFDDGMAGEVDLSHKPHTGVYKRWKDYDFFRSARIDPDGQLAWDEQLDFSADSLWLQVNGRRPPQSERGSSIAHA